MRKIILLLLVLASYQSQSQVVISQVYGGGGNGGSTYTHDFIELFNRGNTTINLTGWSVQYASSTGSTWAQTDLSSVSLAPGQYYLIQQAMGAGGTTPLPTADVIGTIAMSATAGKVTLVNNTTGLTGTCPTGAMIVDFVGFGTAANCFEGTGPTPAPSNTNAVLRALNGCTDTNDNSADFTAGLPTPRNTASTFNVCGAATPTLSATALTAFGNVCINTTAGPNSFTITGTTLTAANVTVGALAGFTYSTTSGGTYTATLSLTQPGGSFSQQIFVRFTPTAVQSYNGNIALAGGGAPSINVAAAGAGVNSIPTVTSGAASAITTTTATVAGTLPSIGCSPVTVYGIEYSTTLGFPNGTGTAVPSSNLSGINYSSALTGLAAGTIYYYHAYATNTQGTAYGTELNFTTASATPTLSATALTAFGNVCINTTTGPNSFTITGTALTAANVTVSALAGFTYSITSGGTYTTTLSLTQPGGAFSQQIFVRFSPTAVQSYSGNIPVGGGGATAINVAAAGAGVNSIPTVTSSSASAITATTATVAGTLPSIGCSPVTVYGIEYSITLGFPNGGGAPVPSTNLSGVDFSAALTGLTASTTYYYHAYATNAAGTAYGTELSFTTGSSTPTTSVVISQVYGGGGNAGSTYTNDFIELFNRGNTTANLSGWSVQYASSTGSSWAQTDLTSVSIAPGQYYLIQQAAGTGGTIPLPTPDVIGTIAIASTAGKVALVNNTTGLSGTCPTGSMIIDFVGFGSAANCFEGTGPAPAPSNTNAVHRAVNGCTDTNDNSADFTAGLPTPRNTASPFNVCGAATPTLSATALTAFGNVCINTTAGPNSFTITGTTLTAANVTVAALAGFTYSTTSGGTYTTTLNLTQPGGSFSQQIFVRFTPTAVQSYSGNIVVAGGGAPSINVAAAGAGVNSIPTVTSGAASAITATTATVAGTLPSIGCSAVTAYGIEYSTTIGFPNGTGLAVPSTNLSGINFSSALTGLTASTTYYYHAYATNTQGTAYGAEQNFVTIGTAPALTVSAITGFGNVCLNTTAGPNSFTITGTNLTTADVTVAALAGFTYSTTSGGTYTTSLSLTHPAGGYSQQIFVRFTPTAVQSYNGNIAVGGGGAPTVNRSVTGAGVNTAPSVTSGTASAITQVSATVAGTISSIGCSALITYGIEFSTTNGFPNGTGIAVASANLSGINFSSALTSLTLSTTYYYHAYATNAGGTTYGNQGTFTTAAPVLTATTLTGFGANCINSTTDPNSFVINSTAVTAANINVGALAGFTYSTTAGGTYTASLSLTHPAGPYSQTIFVKFTPVAVLVYAGNIVVSGGGASVSINVAASGIGVNTAPAVATGNSTIHNPNSITLAGTVIGTGCSPVTGYGIEYSSISGLANGQGIKIASTNISGGNFSATLNGLVQGATYYYKAYAVNSGGTTYGIEKTFTMTSIPTGFVIYSNPILRGTNLHYTYKNIKPGHYQIQIVNALAQLVFQRELIVGANFIDDNFIVPAYLTPGSYFLMIRSPDFYDSEVFMIK